MRRLLLALSTVLFVLPAHATTTLYSNSTSVGIGTTSPASELQVFGGEAQIGSSGATCVTGLAGALRYATGSVSVCDGTSWDVIGGSSGGPLPALTSGDIWVGNASNVATATALSGDCTLGNTGAITCTKTNGTAFGALATQFGVNLSTQATGTLQAGQFPALTGDVTTPAGSLATTVAAIQGTNVSGTTGTGNVVFSASPALTGSPTAPTPTSGDNSTKLATTAFVQAALSGSGGGMTLLATVNASNSATVSFGSTYLTSSYNAYKIVIDSLLPVTNSVNFELQVSNDGGSTWKSTNYFWQIYNSSFSSSASYVDVGGGQQLTNSSGRVTQFEITFSNPAATNITTFFINGALWNSGGTLNTIPGIGAYQTAGAVNAVRFLFSSGNISTGNFHLYGLSGT